jgi:hypothetical protein
MSDINVDFFGGLTAPQTAESTSPTNTIIDFFGGLTQPVETSAPQGAQQPGGGSNVVDVSQFVRDGRRILRTTYANGQFTENDLGPEEAATTTPIAAREFDEDAFARLNSLLGRIGLETLGPRVRELVARGVTEGDSILFELRDTNEYKTRFAGNAARATKGLPELDASTYVALEDAYRQTMRAAGLDLEFYNQPTDFQRLIENDVSVSEFNSRIQDGFMRVRDADPEVKRQMQRLYNVGEAELAAYFIDPERAAPLLTRQAQAAQVSARAREQAGMQLLSSTAEDLIARGYTPEQAQSVFERAGQLAGLYQEMGSEEALTQEQKVGAAFGFDVEALRTLERRQATRVAEFQGGGGFARTSGATSGVVQTGAGTAQ